MTKELTPRTNLDNTSEVLSDAFLTEMRAAMWPVAWRQTRTEADADDLVQDAMIQLCKAVETGKADFVKEPSHERRRVRGKAFARTQLVHVASTWRRRSKRFAAEELTCANEPAFDPRPSEGLSSTIFALLEACPHAELLLEKQLGCSAEDSGAVHGHTPGTVYKYRSKALKDARAWGKRHGLLE